MALQRTQIWSEFLKRRQFEAHEFLYKVGTGKKGNKCDRIYYLADFFHPVKDIGIVDFMNKNQKKSAKA